MEGQVGRTTEEPGGGGPPSLPLQQLGAAPGTSVHQSGIGAPREQDAVSQDSFAELYGDGEEPRRGIGYGPVGVGRSRSRWDQTPEEAAAARGAAEADAAAADALAALRAVQAEMLPGAGAGESAREGAEANELRELRALQAQVLAK